MSSGLFHNLRSGNSSSSSSLTGYNNDRGDAVDKNSQSHEDLSSMRADEETVLQAVYENDFTREEGPWGCPRLNVHVRPPDTNQNQIGSQLKLSVQLGKNYPYVPPRIELKDVIGLSREEQKTLYEQLVNRSKELVQSGSVAMLELVKVTEAFLLVHNQDPTMSAWDIMKTREETERKIQQEKEEKFNRFLMDQSSQTQSPAKLPPTDGSHHRQQHNTEDVEREWHRQGEALVEARRKPRLFGQIRTEEEEEEPNILLQDEDNDFQDDPDGPETNDEQPPLGGTSSRYETDFVELGILGRGGGGEVVKVRNRLDRRIYAIKKIILESERGQFAKSGAIQNRKLRREVTTISRMTHNNIVRYYQAWVEGGDDPINESTNEGKEQHSRPNVKSEISDDRVDEHEGGRNEDESDTSSSESGIGFFEKRSSDHIEESSFSSSDDQSSVDEYNIDIDGPLQKRDLHSQSMEDLLHQENELGLESPLLNGIGFQNQMYTGLYKKKTPDSPSSELEPDLCWDESSVKVDTSQNQRVLYIQMEYCATTLRKLIDDQSIINMDENNVWRLIRQTIEALVYIHSRNIIHRDLKPSNIFLDAEGNVRLGDFGLATRHLSKDNANEEVESTDAYKGNDIETMEDISALLGGSAVSASQPSHSETFESMTGGVGTTFYRAPEQEGVPSKVAGDRSDGSYNVQADIFSLGVILFEMFHPPFETYMERAEKLTKLRGDYSTGNGSTVKGGVSSRTGDLVKKEDNCKAKHRFPPKFIQTVPENAQNIILWCLERDPSKRPSAEQLLASDLLPRKIEVEQHYLEEALRLLTNPHSESYMQILEALFDRPIPDVVEITYDTDVAAVANNMGKRGDKRVLPPSEGFMQAITEIRAGAVDAASLQSLAMSAPSLVAATSALQRARNSGRVGKGGKGWLKRSTQRTAGILAMKAATSAAITGTMDGVHGADPALIESICHRLCTIFQSHGAVPLKSPLLRPRPNSVPSGNISGSAQVVNNRGIVLLLPEDLTATFARAVGRGGYAASSVKRYDIDRTYHKSMAGGHPREALEATFDIIQDDPNVKGHQIEAEALIVVSQVMGAFCTQEEGIPNRLLLGARSPMWYLRLTHTRLTDTILELCGVPQKENLRRACCRILTYVTAPAPQGLSAFVADKKEMKTNRTSVHLTEQLNRYLADVVRKGLPKATADKLRDFILKCCLPLPYDIKKAIERVELAVAHLRSMEDLTRADPRRIKRFDDVGRSLRSLDTLTSCLNSLGISPLLGSNTAAFQSPLSRPLYISFDLGLRQRRKTFHGQIMFQCIMIPDNYFDGLGTNDSSEENNDIFISSSGPGIKIAEGGRYDELVRKCRPPGNFGSALFNYYTTAPIPMCVGVRFLIGRLVELVYLEAALSNPHVSLRTADASQKFTLDKNGMEFLRRSLGHPLKYSSPVRCIVASVNGMDTASSSERLSVAARLWSEGIPAEYLPQSGCISSLLRQLRAGDSRLIEAGASDWSLDELQGVCAILKIPFIVIVQPHLLRDKGSVRLRRVMPDDMAYGFSAASSSGGSEVFVSLENLSSTIRDMYSETTSAVYLHENAEDAAEGLGRENPYSREATTSTRTPRVECIYVHNDHYFSNDNKVSKSDTSKFKAVLKAMKGVTRQGEQFLSSLQDYSSSTGLRGVPLFAVEDLPFWVLRDFGTYLMRFGVKEQSAHKASIETTQRYPRGKRELKTLAMAIDSMMKRNNMWDPHRDQSTRAKVGSQLVTILLYSKLDDRFDMVTIEGADGIQCKHRK